MIGFRLKELLLDKEFHIGRKITQEEIAHATGLHRTTLSKIASQRGYNTTTDNIDKLCRYLKCKVEDLMQYIPDEEVIQESER